MNEEQRKKIFIVGPGVTSTGDHLAYLHAKAAAIERDLILINPEENKGLVVQRRDQQVPPPLYCGEVDLMRPDHDGPHEYTDRGSGNWFCRMCNKKL